MSSLAVIVVVLAAVFFLSSGSAIGTRVDAYVLTHLGELARRSAAVDKFVTVFLGFGSVKLLPIVALAWGLWFLQTDRQKTRWQIVSGIVGLFAGFVVGRVLQDLAPYRPRPMHSGDPHFIAPFGDIQSIEHWSSFPSDHAVISFGLATIIFRISRPFGTACYLWATFIVCMPRVYDGMHYASDIIAGALLGTGAVVVTSRLLLPAAPIATAVLNFEETYSGIFYALAFALSYQLVTMFDDVRHTAMYLVHVIAN